MNNEKEKDKFDPFGLEETAAAQASPAAESGDPYAKDVQTDTSVIACPSCGANMVYDAETGDLYCEHCGTRQQIFAHASEEQSFENLLRQTVGWAEESHVFLCRNCGAREVLDKNEIAKTCPFCGTSNIVQTDELPGLRPNAILPFHITKDDAASNVRKWFKKAAARAAEIPQERPSGRDQGGVSARILHSTRARNPGTTPRWASTIM